MRDVRLCAVCCNTLTSPSADVILLVKLSAVCSRLLMSPSADSMRDVRASLVTLNSCFAAAISFDALMNESTMSIS